MADMGRTWQMKVIQASCEHTLRQPHPEVNMVDFWHCTWSHITGLICGASPMISRFFSHYLCDLSRPQTDGSLTISCMRLPQAAKTKDRMAQSRAHPANSSSETKFLEFSKFKESSIRDFMTVNVLIFCGYWHCTLTSWWQQKIRRGLAPHDVWALWVSNSHTFWGFSNILTSNSFLSEEIQTYLINTIGIKLPIIFVACFIQCIW